MSRSRLVAFVAVLAIAVVPAAGAFPSLSDLTARDVDAVQVNPVATDELTYQLFGRVFSDPHGCFVHGGLEPPVDVLISPWAKGNMCAIDYLSYSESVEGTKFLERRFPRYLEVTRLDELYDDPGMMSAGLPRAVATSSGDLEVLGRDRSPLYLFKVTDSESPIPEEDRLHFVFSLSIHGLERAGHEGGIRAMEDLITWAACENGDDGGAPACDAEGPFPKPIIESEVPEQWADHVPTAGEALEQTVSYFIMTNPDGHKAGQKTDPIEIRDGNLNPSYVPGASFARGNGNGVDLNRDWPSIGYTQRSHQPWSEPESRYIGEALLDIRDRLTSGHFAGGIDLHGMLDARAFSYTLLGADQRDYRKNQITVDTSLRTYWDQTERLRWSPYVGDSTGDGEQDRPAPIPVADEWGTIYDTIGYTVTGAMGFFMDDSRIGLGGVGINNEMALSNLAPNTVYEPALNQTHIDGNKGLIYSQIASLIYEDAIDQTLRPGGKVGYVHNPVRITDDGSRRAENPGLPAQPGINTLVPCQTDLQPQLTGGCDGAEFELGTTSSHLYFDVLGPDDGYWNGGMTVTSTRPLTEQGANVPAVHAGVVIERWAEDHGDGGQWVVVKDLARTSVTLNDPVPGEYRIEIPHASGFPRRVTIDFDRHQAEEEPGRLPYDVSSMDFFEELNPYVPEGSELEAVQVEQVLGGAGTLRNLDTLVVTNNLGVRDYLETEIGLNGSQVERYFGQLREFAEGGGNLILTDAGLHALEEMGVVEDGAVANRGGGSGGSNVAGAYGFSIGGGTITYEDPDAWPLAAGLDLPGAGELSTGRRQAVEPTPLGFNPNSGGTHARMPFWGVDRDAWEAACDKESPELCTTALVAQDSSYTQVGEVGLGDGVVRIVGTLLPDPLETEDEIADNRFGLASYAITYTGYIVFENLIDYQRP